MVLETSPNRFLEQRRYGRVRFPPAMLFWLSNFPQAIWAARSQPQPKIRIPAGKKSVKLPGYLTRPTK